MRSGALPLGATGRGQTPKGPQIFSILSDIDSIGKVIVSSTTAIQLKHTDGNIFIVTGSAAQQIRLPPESTLTKGAMYVFVNRGTGTLSIRSSANSVINILTASSGATSMPTMFAFLQDNTITSNSAWAGLVIGTSYALGKSLTVNNIITFNGQDNAVYTLPSGSATIASAEFDSNFTVNQTFGLGITQTPVAVAALPAVGAGKRNMVNNANAPVWGAVVVGGGAVTVPVYSDGVNWLVG